MLDLDGKKINIIGIDDPKMSFNPSMSDEEIAEYSLSNIEYDDSYFTIFVELYTALHYLCSDEKYEYYI